MPRSSASTDVQCFACTRPTVPPVWHSCRTSLLRCPPGQPPSPKAKAQSNMPETEYGRSPGTRPGKTLRNPLRDPRDRRLNRIAGPSSLVLFGVTGDLARKKLMPAVYDLANRGLLPPSFALVGFGRREWTDEDFASQVKASVQSYAR